MDPVDYYDLKIIMGLCYSEYEKFFIQTVHILAVRRNYKERGRSFKGLWVNLANNYKGATPTNSYQRLTQLISLGFKLNSPKSKIIIFYIISS